MMADAQVPEQNYVIQRQNIDTAHVENTWKAGNQLTKKEVWIKMTPEALKKQWDEEYKRGQWDVLDFNAAERSRSAIIAGTFFQVYKKNGTFLDVGCGEGVMFDYLRPEQQPSYLGVDISREGIEIGMKKRPTASFIVSRAEDFNIGAAKKFDFIVFSEMIYYCDHNKVFEQYAKYLNPGGYIALCTWFREGHASAQMGPSVFDDAMKNFKLVDEMRVSGFTYCAGCPNGNTRAQVHYRIGLFQPHSYTPESSDTTHKQKDQVQDKDILKKQIERLQQKLNSIT